MYILQRVCAAYFCIRHYFCSEDVTLSLKNYEHYVAAREDVDDGKSVPYETPTPRFMSVDQAGTFVAEILTTVDSYSVRDILREVNDFEVSDAFSRMFPNKYLRSKMAIQIDDLIDNMRNKDEISIGDLNLNKQQTEILRQRWRSSCDRKAAKVCIKACRNTYKSVCGSFKCKRSMKRSFKRECKSNCKAKFVSSQYSDGE